MKPADFYVTAQVTGTKYGVPAGSTSNGRRVIVNQNLPEGGIPQGSTVVGIVYGINGARAPEYFAKFVRFHDNGKQREDLRKATS